MRYEDNDMTYAVIKYADDHQQITLRWNDITAWVNDPDTWEKYPVVARLQGIRDYQFYRPIKVKGKQAYRECKRRFDEINAVRKTLEPLPDMISMSPNQFLQLPYSTRVEAILDVQVKYAKLRQDLGSAEMKARSEKVELQWAEQQETRISQLEEEIQTTVKRCNDRYAYIVQQINNELVRQTLEKYDIPMDEPNHVAIIDELKSENRKLFSIRRELEAYRKRNVNDTDVAQNSPQTSGSKQDTVKQMMAEKLKQGLKVEK